MSNTIGKRSYYNCKRPLVLVRGGIGNLREVNFIRVDSDESHIIICRKIKQKAGRVNIDDFCRHWQEKTGKQIEGMTKIRKDMFQIVGKLECICRLRLQKQPTCSTCK